MKTQLSSAEKEFTLLATKMLTHNESMEMTFKDCRNQMCTVKVTQTQNDTHYIFTVERNNSPIAILKMSIGTYQLTWEDFSLPSYQEE